MLPKHLDEYRIELREKPVRTTREVSLLKELEDLARRGVGPYVSNESYSRKHERQETSAWGGSPSSCPVCGK
jgi:hypothetical protein